MNELLLALIKETVKDNINTSVIDFEVIIIDQIIKVRLWSLYSIKKFEITFQVSNNVLMLERNPGLALAQMTTDAQEKLWKAMETSI